MRCDAAPQVGQQPLVCVEMSATVMVWAWMVCHSTRTAAEAGSSARTRSSSCGHSSAWSGSVRALAHTGGAREIPSCTSWVSMARFNGRRRLDRVRPAPIVPGNHVVDKHERDMELARNDRSGTLTRVGINCLWRIPIGSKPQQFRATHMHVWIAYWLLFLPPVVVLQSDTVFSMALSAKLFEHYIPL